MPDRVRRAGRRVAANDPAKVRNVVLVGPSGSGKTTLVEALLAHTAAIRGGHGRRRQHGLRPRSRRHPAARSVALAVAPVMHQDIKIDLIDTPGYGDFVGELRAGLRAADAALFVISAHEVSAQQGGEARSTRPPWRSGRNAPRSGCHAPSWWPLRPPSR